MDGHAAFCAHAGRIADELCHDYLAHALIRRGYSDAIPPTMSEAYRTADVSRIFKLLQPLADWFEDSSPEEFHDLDGFMEFYLRRQQRGNFWTLTTIGVLVLMGGLLAAAIAFRK
ncbi:uncharacterized protein LOC134193401 isoform X2 [Corticium candelabrum]|uniref:uncharacterized protein LOC134193401 isoform X2 n=1 Tax=Corticium candelabrum TaxID=121492 RepID=UPI002E26CC9A|nr:uncharacterized protein LOC134193401 isoform X2 [Corticium candelabrum]